MQKVVSRSLCTICYDLFVPFLRDISLAPTHQKETKHLCATSLSRKVRCISDPLCCVLCQLLSVTSSVGSVESAWRWHAVSRLWLGPLQLQNLVAEWVSLQFGHRPLGIPAIEEGDVCKASRFPDLAAVWEGDNFLWLQCCPHKQAITSTDIHRCYVSPRLQEQPTSTRI